MLAKCGWGVLDSAVTTSDLIERHQPDRVILIGIAGTYRPENFPVGSATELDCVRRDGIGVGQHFGFQSADELGWESPFGSELALDSSNATPDDVPRRVLLTVCSASASVDEAKWRQQRFPDAIAEDMEGFAVAMCCRHRRIPVQIIRGFSNVAGERNHSSWRIEQAIDAVSALLMPFCTQKQ